MPHTDVDHSSTDVNCFWSSATGHIAADVKSLYFMRDFETDNIHPARMIARSVPSFRSFLNETWGNKEFTFFNAYK